MKRNSSRLVILAIGVVAPILIVLARLAWRSITPDPLPTHWSVTGQVNGTTGAGGMFGWSLGISVALAIGAIAISDRRQSPDAGRLLASILTGGSWQVAAVYLLSMSVSRHAGSAGAVHLPWFALVLSVAVPVTVGALVWFLLPSTSTPARLLPHSDIQLGRSERVTWISHVHSTPLRVVAVTVTLVAAVLVFFSALPAIAVFVVALLLAGTSELAVRIDADGLHTLWGPFGWPRPVIPLPAISEAHAEHISPMQWGGWGFRMSSRGTAANVRSGPGIVVQKRGGSRYVVTIDDADEGADVLNALLVRATDQGRGSGVTP